MIRALIADDERPARQKLRLLLSRRQGIEIVGEAVDGDEAVREVERTSPDVVFLDIRMPRRDGFGVIDALGPGRTPLVVFVTAYGEHALRAFKVHAVDYLLKPFSASRVDEVIGRIQERLAARRGAEGTSNLQRALEEIENQSGWLRRLRVEAQPNHEILLPLERVDVISAHGNYLELQTADRRYLRRGTLSDLLRRLDPRQFARINRSEIVRLDAIRELQPWFHGDYRVVLKSGPTLAWSRRYRARRDEL
jgi:two-component system, LytTR family, response regulator